MPKFMVHSEGFGLLWWLSGKYSAAIAEDMSLIPGLGRSPGEGNGKPLQHSCLGNPWTEPGRLKSMGSQRNGYN